MDKQSKPYYQVGNTVFLQGRFLDLDGSAFTPDMVTLIIYDYRWVQIESISVAPTAADAEGFYMIPHVFNEVGKFYYEWKGETNGEPVLERNEIEIRQM